jgi:hypothetical protein
VKRRLVAAAAIVGTAGAIAVPAVVFAGSPAMSAQSACVHLSINVNGTAQTLDQCLP